MFKELTLGEARKLGMHDQIAGMEDWPDSAPINVPAESVEVEQPVAQSIQVEVQE